MVDVARCARGAYTNVAAIEAAIAEGPFDAVVAASPENVPYYSGFWNDDLRGIPERVHFVLWPKAGSPAFIVTGRRKEAFVEGDTFLRDIVPYEGEDFDSIRALADALTARGVTTGRVGIEERFFSAAHLAELKARLPELTFEDASRLLERPRLIKTPAEIELITRLADWTSRAIDAAFEAARPGDTEKAIAARMQHELLMKGADLIAFHSFGAGERSGLFHGLASDKVIEEGMIITTDFGGFKSGYFSDLARTVVMGKASPRQRDIYAKVQEVKHRIVAGIRPGMFASEVAKLGRQAYADLGLEFKWAILGHSIGLGIHESPQIYPWVDEPILPGMAMMIETGYTDYPNDSFHVEDLILITDSGAEYASDFSRHEELWEIGT